MGFPIACRILAAGNDLICSSRSPAPVNALVERGANSATSAGEAAESSEVVILSLPDDHAVESVTSSMLGSVEGRVVVDCSTISPQLAMTLHARVAEAGGSYLDAPVSGGPYGAAEGTLSVMVGGDAEALDRARPAIACFSGLVSHVGSPGSGQIVKLANQLVVGAQILALCEAAILVQRSGIDARQLHQVLIASTADSHMARTRFPVPGVVPTSPATNNWRPDFTTKLMAKDIDLVLAHAGTLGVSLASTEIVRSLLTASSSAGNDELDWSSFFEVLG